MPEAQLHLIFVISFTWAEFLSDPGIPGPTYGSKPLKLREVCADLTDVTLADEDTNSILIEKANMATHGYEAMQTTQSGGKLWNQCKWGHLVANFGTNASGVIWWSYLQLMQVVPCCCQNLVQITESISGSIVPLVMFYKLVRIKESIALLCTGTT